MSGAADHTEGSCRDAGNSPEPPAGQTDESRRPEASAPSRPSTIYNQHIHNSTGSIAQGAQATAITDQGLQPDDIRHLRETFASGLSTLDPLDHQDVQQAIDDLLNDLQADTVDVEQVKRRVGALERLAARIGNAALMAAASEGGKRALELLASSF